MNSDTRVLLRYLIICVFAFFFLLFYLWQSIESTKIRLECRSLLRQQKELLDKNAVYIYEIEKIKNSALSEEQMFSEGYRKALPEEMGVITGDGK